MMLYQFDCYYCYYTPPKGHYVMMLSDVGRWRVRPAGWSVLADQAQLGRPGSRLPLCASVGGLGGGISWWPSAYSLLLLLLWHRL